MIPPIFAICSADPGVAAVLGAGLDCDLYPFGEAPPGLATYAVWQQVGGLKENYMSDTHKMEHFVIQEECWAPDRSRTLSATQTLRQSFHNHAHIPRWSGTEQEPES